MYDVFFPQMYDVERIDIYAVSLLMFYLYSGLVHQYISAQKNFLDINFFFTD